MSIILKTINVISILSLSLFLNMCTNSQSGTIRKDVTDLLNNAGYEVSSFSKMYYEDSILIAFKRSDIYPYWAEIFYVIQGQTVLSFSDKATFDCYVSDSLKINIYKMKEVR